VNGLSWPWILLMSSVPPAAGVLLALPLWRRGEMILGNVAGTIVIFGSALALIFRESVELDRLTRACFDSGVFCRPEPGAFMRYAIYASVGLVQVVALFASSLRIEKNARNRHYAPEWRS
jgi:hypothetical protein